MSGRLRGSGLRAGVVGVPEASGEAQARDQTPEAQALGSVGGLRAAGVEVAWRAARPQVGA